MNKHLRGSKAVKKREGELTVEDIEQQIARLEEQRRVIGAALAPLERKDARLATLISSLYNRKDKLIAGSGNDDWTWLLETFPESEAKYKEREKKLRELGLMNGGGYWVETKQTAINIALVKEGYKYKTRYDNEKQLAAVKLLLPFIRANNKGIKKVEIFEHTLHLNAVYWLEFHEDGSIKLVSSSHGRLRSEIEFKTIEEAFQYVSKHHWYEGEEED